VNEGWQRLVDSLQSAAVSAGVNFVTSSRVVGLLHQAGSVQGIELGELEDDAVVESSIPTAPLREPLGTKHGTKLQSDVVLLAVDPTTAAALLSHHGHVHPAPWRGFVPVRAACLDVALSSLPVPRNTFALGVDRPVYFSVHSRYAHLAPKGGALIHTAKYLTTEAAADTAVEELEQVLDVMQPGWRRVIVHRRYLPRMTVTNALVRSATGSFAGRPDVDATGLRNLFIAGDWVGPSGLLSDAAVSSANRAAERILALR
jgi:phytoene dehydrogenase-like protein